MLLSFCRHLAACHSVTMPALFLRSAQQSTRHKSQNHMKAIYRSHLNKFDFILWSEESRVDYKFSGTICRYYFLFRNNRF